MRALAAQLLCRSQARGLPVVLLQEFFGDYVALDPHHFAVPVARPACLLQPFAWDYASSSDAVSRMTEGLAALALSLRRRFQIRCSWRDGVSHCASLLSTGQPAAGHSLSHGRSMQPEEPDVWHLG